MDIFDSVRIIFDIFRDISRSEDGVTTGEIAEKYGISRRVVPKYIDILRHAGVPVDSENGRHTLDKDHHAAFSLTPEESELLALSLQRSLMLHGTNRRAIRALIAKLGTKMTEHAADLLLGQSDWSDETKLSERWFSLLAEAKRRRREVWVDYLPLNRSEPTRWRIRPYRFMVNAFSDGLYVECEGTRDAATYIRLALKFDRILDVQLADTSFGLAEIAQFVNQDKRAWGVWGAARPPETVVLRFEARHYDRLLESTWHPTQRISIDKAGDVRFTVEVSEPKEMIPWIRSWGAGVVVLEPESLRQRIIGSIRQQMQAYGLTGDAPNAAPLNLLWAKYESVSGQYHPLTCHLLDVAAVAHVMWGRVLSVSQRRWLANVLQMDEATAQRFMAFLVGLHDIGKATSTFQRKARPIYKQLLEAGIPHEDYEDKPHGTYSAAILRLFLKELSPDEYITRLLGAVIGGHHGGWIPYSEIQDAKHTAGGAAWGSLQAELFHLLREILKIDAVMLSDDVRQLNVFAVFLSGFVSVCDWVGSHEEYFPYQMTPPSPAEYFEQALPQAQMALEELGFMGRRPPQTPGVFSDIFSFQPNDLQRAGIDVFNGLHTQPRLILVEYLTGGGKTELALYLADLLMNLYGLSGTYIAMPTQATSNQMFERVSRYLQAQYPEQVINLQLAHAQSDHHPLFQQFQQRGPREGNESGIIAERWFQNRKRTLLAPYAVGTVDQAMLSVLQVKHHFVRQYALSHKVVIFDEIHSYDTYMNEIINRLMNWLAEMHSPLLLLSATLPENTREQLVRQVGGQGVLADVPYPRMTVVTADGQVEVHPLPRPESRLLHLRHMDGSLNCLADEVAALYAGGGCIAVICNTVGEAIDVARQLRQHGDISPEDVLLFHARFPPALRGGIERHVLECFGKNGQRPERAILVATQIIEQSLDLDFDAMITRTAPIDLLIQRAGRLHRHHRSRPAHLSTPTLMIRAPDFDGDVPKFGVDEAVYQRFVLLRTWLVLRDSQGLHLPDELDAMMNFVYVEQQQADGNTDAYSRALQAAYEKMLRADNLSSFRGIEHVIAQAGNEELIGSFSQQRADDDDHNLKTRDIKQGVDIICMGDAPGLELPQPVNRKPTQEEVKQLLQHRVVIHRTEFFRAIKAALQPEAQWERVTGLRFARAIVFEGGEYVIPGTSLYLKLSPFYGLEYGTKESK